MIVEIAPPCGLDLETFVLDVGSVGIIIPVAKTQTPTHLLIAQQADQPGNPWGIIAGRIDEGETNTRTSARREIKEETGQEVREDELEYIGFHVAKGRAELIPRGALYYRTRTFRFNEFNLREQRPEFDNSLSFLPPKSVSRLEISRLALMPLNRSFDGLLATRMYRDEYNAAAVQLMRRQGLTSGRFYFETDPYLFDPPATDGSGRG